MLELLRQHLKHPVAILNQDGVVHFWNEQMAEMVGLSSVEATGRSFLSILDSSGAVTTETDLSLNSFLEGSPVKFRSTQCAVLIGANQGVDGTMLVEAEMDNSYGTDSSGRAFGWFDLKTGMAHYAEVFRSLLGYDARSLPPVQETWETLVHPDDRDRAREVLEDMHRGVPIICSIRLRRFDGSYQLLHHRFKPRFPRDGGYRIVCLSEAPSGNTLDLVRASGDALTTLLHTVHEAIVLCYVDGTILEMNDIAAGFAGVDPVMARGRPLERVLIVENEIDGSEVTGYVERCVRHRRRYSYGHNRRLRLSDGDSVPVELSAIPLGDRLVTGAIVMLRDLSERRRRDTELRNTQRAGVIIAGARGLNRELGEHVASIISRMDRFHSDSHAAYDPDVVFEAHKRARGELLELKRVIEGITRFVEGSDSEFGISSVDELVREICHSVERSSDVKVDYSLNASEVASLCNRSLLAQALYNITSNARDAMMDGGLLRVETTVRDEDRIVRIRFVDEGYGIAPDNLSRIFEPYYSTKDGAGGLGLSVALSIVRNCGGYIDIESEPGFGTTVDVYLPILAGGIDSISFEGVSVLVVADSNDSPTLQRILEALGCFVVVASDKASAVLEQYAFHERNRRFDLYLIGLENERAIEVLSALKNREPDTPAIRLGSDPVDGAFTGTILHPDEFTEVAGTLRKIF